MRCARWLVVLLLAPAAPAAGQAVNAARLSILQAEERRALTAVDLTTLRTGVRSGDPQTARVAVRALGRLERPALIPDILPALTSRYTEVRSEAAHAVAQAATGARRGAPGGPGSAALFQTLSTRLTVEDDADVRAALAESVGRLTFADVDGVSAAQRALTDLAERQDSVTDRLGVAKAFEALVRTNAGTVLLPASLDVLRRLAGVAPAPPADASGDRRPARTGMRPDQLRDARVRRLAVEALTTAAAMDESLIEHGAADPDSQVRQLTIRAAARTHRLSPLTRALEDPSPMVRLEAVRGVPGAAGDEACDLVIEATNDRDPHVALQAVDQLSACGDNDRAVALLAALASRSTLDVPRSWHRPAHALVALAAAAPAAAEPLVAAFVAARTAFVRVYAARAAELLKDRATLERLAADPDDNVVEAAVDALSRVAGGSAAPQYVAALQRRGYQAVRAAAKALVASEPTAETVAAVNAALARLVSEDHANSTDARTALRATLATLAPRDKPADAPKRPASASPESALTLADLRRLAAPRARFTIRDVGVIDVALITSEAPATVLQFARLAERGYYNGLTIHRVVPNFVLQGGSPDANEYVGQPDYMRDEVGFWPHVRGALGISTRGRDTGDAQFFVDLVDNPRLDHEYTVFAQVITGLDVADQVLEGDVIVSVQILDGR